MKKATAAIHENTVLNQFFTHLRPMHRVCERVLPPVVEKPTTKYKRFLALIHFIKILKSLHSLLATQGLDAPLLNVNVRAS